MASKTAQTAANTQHGNTQQRFAPQEIEPKWRAYWEEIQLGITPDHVPGKENYYSLVMLPYPSGDLHIGHWYNYTGHDAFSRFKRMQGFNVMQPIGFDAFGLPAENAAIKRGVQPRDWTLKNIDTMRQQMRVMGAAWDWSREIVSCQPDYYKWTQWLFLQFYKHGLAYRTKAPANWCPNCNTTLANEQVKDGRCERCNTIVIRKEIDQWRLRITKYAEELLDFDGIEWPEKTVIMQKNWIGRSEGAEVHFTATIKGKKTKAGSTPDEIVDVPVFTTRPDTIYGVTFFVLAPEHPLVEKITTAAHKKAVHEYVEAARRETEIERQSTEKEKTGVFTGGYVTNPISGAKVPVWIADYVLMTYGTGAIMGVPAHDQRDFEFARKYDLPIVQVIAPEDEEPSDPATWSEAHEALGRMVNSGPFDGTPRDRTKAAIIEEIERRGVGKATISYRLRDWLISRQRFWGAPIPIIYCEKDGMVPVPEDQLPVLLPDYVEFKPTGESPLNYVPEFVNTTCPICGEPARRESDTMDTFICSSWYFLRYADPKNDHAPWDDEKIAAWLPVQMYNGGAEHATMHLLYARFFVKALRDMGYLHFDEPFLRLFHQGMVLGPDNQKMSKSRGNVIAPDEVVAKYGADAVRCYLMFMGPFDMGGPWNNQGIEGISRYLNRAWSLITWAIDNVGSHTRPAHPDSDLARLRHKTIKRVTDHYAHWRYNTAIAAMMEMTNALYDARETEAKQDPGGYMAAIDTLIVLLAPLAPYFSEELWHRRGNEGSIHNSGWPTYDEALTIDAVITIPVQINGKLRATIEVPSDADEAIVRATAEANERIQGYISGKTIRKVVYVPGKTISYVIN
jgi:leucyl-tRNA synthetase